MELIDLGSDHKMYYVGWSPDRELNPQYKDVPDIPKFGINIEHLTPQGVGCVGSVTFDLPEVRALTKHAVWQVESWEPLTISPSVLCSCGDHGFIREGKWVKA